MAFRTSSSSDLALKTSTVILAIRYKYFLFRDAWEGAGMNWFDDVFKVIDFFLVCCWEVWKEPRTVCSRNE